MINDNGSNHNNINNTHNDHNDNNDNTITLIIIVFQAREAADLQRLAEQAAGSLVPKPPVWAMTPADEALGSHSEQTRAHWTA